MNKADFDLKYKNVDTDNLEEPEFREFKNDCFSLYEEHGFLDKFRSPYDNLESKIGMGFKVIRRATETEVELDAMPVWLVEFDNGETAYCYPEEITLFETLK